jgi:hypothetical protein
MGVFTGAVAPATTDADGRRAESEAEAVQPPRRDDDHPRWLSTGLLLVALVPFVVSAVALLVVARNEYFPHSDHAQTEMAVRDLGHHQVLVGLYSREGWSHPGPALFYALAPFYWLTGGASIGMYVGALAINGASVAGMGLIARRLGGVPMLVCTLLAMGLLMRTLGAELLSDPWNNFVTVLPFGLMLCLTWALLCRRRWALLPAVVVASFLAQTHVGFAVLALPLLGVGAAWLLLPLVRRSTQEPRDPLVRAALLSAAVGVVLWLPVVLDTVLNSPANLRRVAGWFRHTDAETHGVDDAWRVVSGQFAPKPEWLMGKLGASWNQGQSPFIDVAPRPWLLVLVVAAGVVLWRRGRSNDRGLVLTLGLGFVLAIVAVLRTLGPAFDYRLRWTWVLPALSLATVAYAAWQLVTDRWPWAGRRVLTPLGAAGVVLLMGVNAFSAATAGVPQAGDSDVVQALLPQVLETVDPDEGQVVFSDGPYHVGHWYARALDLQLERRGFDVRVPPSLGLIVGQHRVYDPDAPIQATLVVLLDDLIEAYAGPGRTLVAYWEADGYREWVGTTAELHAAHTAGRIDDTELFLSLAELQSTVNGGEGLRITNTPRASRVGVYLDENRPPE